MKKLTKRNRTHNRKVVFGYHTECPIGDIPNHTTTLTTDKWGFRSITCTYTTGACCDGGTLAVFHK